MFLDILGVWQVKMVVHKTKESFGSQKKTPVKSGRARSSRPSGTAEQRRYYSTPSTPTPSKPAVQYVVDRKDVTKEQYEAYVADFQQRATAGKLTEQEVRTASAYRAGVPSQPLEQIRQQEIKRIATEKQVFKSRK